MTNFSNVDKFIAKYLLQIHNVTPKSFAKKTLSHEDGHFETLPKQKPILH